MEWWWWILLMGMVTIAAIWFMNREWSLDRLNVPEGFLALQAQSQSQSQSPWSQNAADTKARVGNVCSVMDRFPDSELAGAVVEIVDSTCESGLPHTVGLNTIRIPANVWASGEDRRQSVLRHERVHLQQRRNARAWETFYREEWGYTLHAEPPASMPAEAVAAVRGNPDTWPHRWAAWNNRYWFVPTYTDVESPTLPAATVRVWDAEAGTWLAELPLAWRVQFCDTERGMACPYQSEHPAEISAEYVTDLDRWTHTAAAMSLRRFLGK